MNRNRQTLMDQNIRVLIVDDEELGRLRMQQLLEHELSFTIAASCGGGEEAVDWLVNNQCDLVFLDIQMPEVDGFEVIARVSRFVVPEKLPLIVFVTAYQEYAIDAFRIHALDYLLKPVDRELFQETVLRIKATLFHRNQQEYHERLKALLLQHQALQNDANGIAQQSFKTRYISIKQGERIFPVQYGSIVAVEASGNYLTIQCAENHYKIRSTLTAFLQQARHQPIQQINRSVAINLEGIKEIQHYFKGDFAILMKNGLQYITSSKYRRAIAELIS